MGSSTNPVALARQSPLRGAMLTLLVQRPAHGYELWVRLDRMLGPGWNVQRQSLYPMLRSMHGEGLIAPVSPLHDESGRVESGKIVFAATERAEPVVDAWMSTLVSLEEGPLQLEARMVVARVKDLPHLLVALDRYERKLFAKRAEWDERVSAPRSLRAAMMGLVRDASLQRIGGELLWVDKSRRAIRALMQAGA